MRNLFNDLIFPTFVTSAEIDIDNAGVLNECYSLKELDAGVNRSNRDGWHSNVFNQSNPPFKGSHLYNIQLKAIEFGNKVLELHSLDALVSSIHWWININPQYSYNVLHSHPKVDLAIVYYAQIPVDSGPLVLVRNDGAIHTNLFNRVKSGNKIEIFPEVGRMYAFPAHVLHYVASNQSSEDRVSLAFNLSI